MIHLNINDTIRVLREIVAEKPEGYTYKKVSIDGYETCRYVEHEGETMFGIEFSEMVNPQPSCLVGVFLHRMGVPLEELHTHEGKIPDTLIPALSHIVTDYDGATGLLSVVQSSQDMGNPWSTAVESNAKFYVTE